MHAIKPKTLYLIITIFISFTFLAGCEVSVKTSFENYIPLEIGNVWEYKSTNFRKEGQTRNYMLSISRKEVNAETGMISYFNDKDELIYYKTEEGVITSSGFMFLKDPIEKGSSWVSGENNFNQTLFTIEDVGVYYNVDGQTFTDCIKIKTTSQFHATPRDDKVVYTAKETSAVYCRDVGKVFSEAYDVVRDNGEKTLLFNIKLVSFKRDQGNKKVKDNNSKAIKSELEDGVSNYMPLRVGSVWEYRTTIKKGSEEETSTEKTIIEKVKDENYYDENNTLIFRKTKNHIYSAQNSLLLKGPIKIGTTWSSGYNYTSIIKEVGMTLNVAGKTYNDCVKVKRRTPFYEEKSNNQVIYEKIEKEVVYCKNIGRVYRDAYVVIKGGDKALIYKDELISFKQESIIGKVEQIGIDQSFKFPTKGFSWPLMSPDEKWLIYHRNDRRWYDPWDMIYYTKVGERQQNKVPIVKPKGTKKLYSVGGYKKWSPNGHFLAFSVEFDQHDHTIIVDFSGEKPIFVEAIKSLEGKFVWSEETLFYLDEFGNIMKTQPGKKPVEVVHSRSSYSTRGSIENFDLASNDNLIYQTGRSGDDDKIFLAHISGGKARKLINSAEGLYRFKMSPDGNFVILFFGEKARLINLKTNKETRTLPKIEAAEWSPNNKFLAYLDDDTESFNILNLETNELNNVKNGILEWFSWSPNSEYIIYGPKRVNSFTHQKGLFLMKVINSSEVLLSKFSPHSLAPVISKLGNYIIWRAANTEMIFVSKNPLESALFSVN